MPTNGLRQPYRRICTDSVKKSLTLKDLERDIRAELSCCGLWKDVVKLVKCKRRNRGTKTWKWTVGCYRSSGSVDSKGGACGRGLTYKSMSRTMTTRVGVLNMVPRVRRPKGDVGGEDEKE